MKKLEELKKHLKPGKLYRRSDLTKWSKAVDRHIHQLQEEGVLQKLSGGLYYYPKETSFGKAPAEDEKLIRTFLKDNRFLLTSPNAYNMLGVTMTQLYNLTVVYNHKRHGVFKLGKREFDFKMKPYFPSKLTREFLLVDLVNNLDQVAEDKEKVLGKVKKKMHTMDMKKLSKAVSEYAGVKAKNFFAQSLPITN